MAYTHIPLLPNRLGGATPAHGPTALLAVLLFLTAAFAACGGSDSPNATAELTAAPSATGTATVEFASVSAGFGHTCGLMRDGSVQCWGSNVDGRAAPAGRGVRLRQRRYPPHVRGEARRLLECWGRIADSTGYLVREFTPPSGEFASVSAGGFHTCG